MALGALGAETATLRLEVLLSPAADRNEVDPSRARSIRGRLEMVEHRNRAREEEAAGVGNGGGSGGGEVLALTCHGRYERA